MMNYSDLEALLTRRLEVIGDAEMRESNPDLQLKLLIEVSEKIEAWKTNHLSEVPAKLRHFLEQYSLEKALDFIQNEKPKRCG